MKIKINDQCQLGLGLPTPVPVIVCPSASRARNHRRHRATLWFEHMRRVVDQATDWNAVTINGKDAVLKNW